MAIEPGKQFKLYQRSTFPQRSYETEPFVYEDKEGEVSKRPKDIMRSISRTAREEPVEEKIDFAIGQPVAGDWGQVIISPWMSGDTREGRSQIAGELGLPNKKRKKKKNKE